jgi:hypothetical protein
MRKTLTTIGAATLALAPHASPAAAQAYCAKDFIGGIQFEQHHRGADCWDGRADSEVCVTRGDAYPLIEDQRLGGPCYKGLMQRRDVAATAKREQQVIANTATELPDVDAETACEAKYASLKSWSGQYVQFRNECIAEEQGAYNLLKLTWAGYADQSQPARSPEDLTRARHLARALHWRCVTAAARRQW